MKNSENNQNREAWEEIIGRLEQVRDKEDITQDELTERTGIKQGHISRLFACKYPPDP